MCAPGGTNDSTAAAQPQLVRAEGPRRVAHRSWLRTEGFSDLVFDGRPVIGIANSWSELTNCNPHLRQVAEAVKRGVWSAGGFPLEFPTISLGEVLMKPTAYPLDAVILLSGCDKTTPAMLMGAASCDVPAIMVTGGPMLRGVWRQEELGSGTDLWRLWAEHRAGRLSDEEFCEAESCMSRSWGHCMVMGTPFSQVWSARLWRHFCATVGAGGILELGYGRQDAG